MKETNSSANALKEGRQIEPTITSPVRIVCEGSGIVIADIHIFLPKSADKKLVHELKMDARRISLKIMQALSPLES